MKTEMYHSCCYNRDLVFIIRTLQAMEIMLDMRTQDNHQKRQRPRWIPIQPVRSPSWESKEVGNDILHSVSERRQRERQNPCRWCGTVRELLYCQQKPGCYCNIFYCCVGWGYIVAFRKAFTIYQIYHTWIHPTHCSPLFYPSSHSWISFNRYRFHIYIHVYTVFAP
jgi:hypothetical protein